MKYDENAPRIIMAEDVKSKNVDGDANDDRDLESRLSKTILKLEEIDKNIYR